MKIGKAITYAILFWIAIFVVISVIMYSGLSETIQTVLHFIAVPIIVLLLTKSYFRKEKAGLSEGIKLALVFLVVGTILDLVITVPLFVGSVAEFYDWELIVGMTEMVVFTAISGVIYNGRKKAVKVMKVRPLKVAKAKSKKKPKKKAKKKTKKKK